MRLNIFQYHVQDRRYTGTEVVSLINDESFKHHLLSGGEHFYSSGSIAEIAGTVVSIVTVIAGIILVAAAPNDYHNRSYNNRHSNNTTYVYNNTSPSSQMINLNAKAENGKFEFTGKEVTAFLNKYYNYHLLFNSKVYYDNVVSDLLNHKYIDADVPTSNEWFNSDVAVLDVSGDSMIVNLEYISY